MTTSDEELEAAGLCKEHGAYLPCAFCKSLTLYTEKQKQAEEKREIEKEQEHLAFALDGIRKERQDETIKPEHYNSDPSGLEAIDVIEDAPSNLAMAAKYLWRGGKKDGQPTERDIEKARWYLFREFYRQGYITLEQWERIVGRK